MSIGTVGQSAKLNFSEKDPQTEQNREDTHRMTNDRHLRIQPDGDHPCGHAPPPDGIVRWTHRVVHPCPSHRGSP